MSLILLIDTATERAMVGIAKEDVIIQEMYNESFKNHAPFLQVAVQCLFAENGLTLNEIDAVAITAGPGSYTGLRVGMSSAKGFCYALRVPLITLNTLETLALSAIYRNKEQAENSAALYCPLIDARRMEVYAAIYNVDMEMIVAPFNPILSALSFEEELREKKIIFFGNGAKKWEHICINPNADFQDISIVPQSMALLAEIHISQKIYTNLAKSSPFYLKEPYIIHEKYKKS